MLTPLLPQRRRPRTVPVEAPASVGCACGQSLAVRRQAQHQIISCPACGRPVFVLPRSPWPTVEPSSPSPVPVRSAVCPRWRFWLWPLLAGAATLALIAATLAALWPLVGRNPAPVPNRAVAPAADQALDYQIFEGRRALNEGAFQVARQILTGAWDNAERSRARLPAERRRQLLSWKRQAALLAELSTEPLADIVVHAQQAPEREWQVLFPTRYRDKGVVFDCTVRRDAAGQVLADWEESVGGQPVRLTFGSLTLLQRLPLQEAQRLLFGARLANVRQAEADWLVEFVPDSGVLITETGIFTGTPLPPDPELVAVMKRQESWLDWELP